MSDEIYENGPIPFIRKRTFIIVSYYGKRSNSFNGLREKIWTIYENPTNKLECIGNLFVAEGVDYKNGLHDEFI